MHDPFRAALQDYQAGRLAEAGRRLRSLLRANPRHADGLHLLGLVAYGNGRLEVAVGLFDRVLGLEPENASCAYNRGIALAALGRMAEAAESYRMAVALEPDYAEALTNLGLVLNVQGKLAEALAVSERAVFLKPDLPDAHNNLGLVLIGFGRLEEAAACFQRALELRPDYAEACNNLGVARKQQGEVDAAISLFERSLAFKPDRADAHSNLAVMLRQRNRAAEARAHLERAVAIDPRHPDANNNLGILLRDEGRFDEAAAHYARAISARPDCAEAHFNRADIRRFRAGDPELRDLEALAGRTDLSDAQRVYVHFALAKAMDDTGRYDDALRHLRRGNALKRRTVAYDEVGALGMMRRIRQTFDHALCERLRGLGDPSEVPIFVLGMPRSGSTLVEQILASHPQVFGAGELSHLEELAAQAADAGAPDGAALQRIAREYLARLPKPGDGRTRIVDKAPGNFLRIGLIHLLFPGARIIHTVRDPVDTCLSCYTKLFSNGFAFAYDLAELGRYYRAYADLMDHWRRVLPPGALLDVSYEEIVRDCEGQTRRLLDHCGLPWDDRCLEFHRTERTIKTASAAQVRQPLFRSSIQRWRRYEAGLGPLLRELGRPPGEGAEEGAPRTGDRRSSDCGQPALVPCG